MAGDEWREWWQLHGERELRCILMTAWDPVGAGHSPEAWDEYDDYALGVAHRLRDATDPEGAQEAVSDYLTHTEVEFMGITSVQRAKLNGLLSFRTCGVAGVVFPAGGRPPRDWIDEQ